RLAALENGARVVDEPEFEEAGELQSYEGILSRSPQMLSVVRTLKDLEDGDVSVLVQGETGTGKELVARAVHARSRRRSGPFAAGGRAHHLGHQPSARGSRASRRVPPRSLLPPERLQHRAPSPARAARRHLPARQRVPRTRRTGVGSTGRRDLPRRSPGARGV